VPEQSFFYRQPLSSCSGLKFQLEVEDKHKNSKANSLTTNYRNALWTRMVVTCCNYAYCFVEFGTNNTLIIDSDKFEGALEVDAFSLCVPLLTVAMFDSCYLVHKDRLVFMERARSIQRSCLNSLP